jgi:hypothetical protein
LVTLDRILNRITGVISGCWWLVVVNAIRISDICQINQQNISSCSVINNRIKKFSQLYYQLKQSFLITRYLLPILVNHLMNLIQMTINFLFVYVSILLFYLLIYFKVSIHVMDTLLITLISLFSNLISQILNFPIQNQQSLNIFLVTDRKMCFNFFLFADTLRSLSFARR